MNVLVLGASSAIGSQLALEFSGGNRLVLAGRNKVRLEQSARACRGNGAIDVTLLPGDLDSGYLEIEDAAKQGNVDLVINAASATSRFRDNEIEVSELGKYVSVDLVSPLRLVDALSKHRGAAPLSVIFVSSVLALVKSPNRSIYGGLKSAHELLLSRMLRPTPGRRLLVVRIGSVLPTDEITNRTIALGRATREAFERNQQVLFYGLAGRMLSWLYFVQPLLFRATVEVHRTLRRSRSKV